MTVIGSLRRPDYIIAVCTVTRNGFQAHLCAVVA